MDKHAQPSNCPAGTPPATPNNDPATPAAAANNPSGDGHRQTADDHGHDDHEDDPFDAEDDDDRAILAANRRASTLPPAPSAYYSLLRPSSAPPSASTGLTADVEGMTYHPHLGSAGPGHEWGLSPFFRDPHVQDMMRQLGAVNWQGLEDQLVDGRPHPNLRQKWVRKPVAPSSRPGSAPVPSPLTRNLSPGPVSPRYTRMGEASDDDDDNDNNDDNDNRPHHLPRSAAVAAAIQGAANSGKRARTSADKVPEAITDVDPQLSPSAPAAAQRRRTRPPTAHAMAALTAAHGRVAPQQPYAAFGGHDFSLSGARAAAATRTSGGHDLWWPGAGVASSSASASAWAGSAGSAGSAASDGAGRCFVWPGTSVAAAGSSAGGQGVPGGEASESGETGAEVGAVGQAIAELRLEEEEKAEEVAEDRMEGVEGGGAGAGLGHVGSGAEGE